MRKMSLLSATALRSALFIGATSAFALPAAAQTAQPAVDPAAQAAQAALSVPVKAMLIQTFRASASKVDSKPVMEAFRSV